MQAALTNLVLNYLTAIGTAGAFVVAVVIFWTSTRAAKLDRRKSQAVLVDAWIKTVRKDSESHRVIFEVSNHSDQAIRQLNIQISTNISEIGRLLTRAIVPPTVRGVYLSLQSDPIPTSTAMADLDEDMIRGFYRIDITFVDTAGRRWNRNFQGRLTELK